MWRTVLSIVCGLVAWGLIATLLNNFGLRLFLPGYAQAEPAMSFTPAMQIARLLLAAVAGLGTGALVRVVAPESRAAPWVAGLILLALFVPMRIRIWDKFPLWYHLTFLITLAPLIVLGAPLWSRTRPGAPLES